MTLKTTIAIAAAGLALAPATASAASLSVDGADLTFTAAAGERNSVFYTRDSGQPADTITIGDLAGDISYPSDRCDESNGSVRCVGITGTITLELGDGDDSSGQPSGDTMDNRVVVHGGPGNDELKSPDRGAGTAVLFGDAGTDVLKGARNRDELHGGAGNDTLDGYGDGDALFGDEGDDTLDGDTYQEAAADIIDGGAGTDRVAGWTGPTPDDHPPVSITLDGAANDGRAGEGDNVASVEKLVSHVSGTFAFSDASDTIDVWANLDSGASKVALAGGDDVFRGGTFEETVDGGAGNDRIDAGYGNDTIVAGPGKDVVFGDKATPDCGLFESCSLPYGDDTIDVRDGETDQVTCGVGTDRVLADPDDQVAPDCEKVERGGGPGFIRDPTDPRSTCTVTAKRRGKVVKVSGKVTGADAGSSVTIRLYSGKRRVASAHEFVEAGGRFAARLRTRKRKRLTVRVAVVGTSLGGKAKVR